MRSESTSELTSKGSKKGSNVCINCNLVHQNVGNVYGY